MEAAARIHLYRSRPVAPNAAQIAPHGFPGLPCGPALKHFLPDKINDSFAVSFVASPPENPTPSGDGSAAEACVDLDK